MTMFVKSFSPLDMHTQGTQDSHSTSKINCLFNMFMFLQEPLHDVFTGFESGLPE